MSEEPSTIEDLIKIKEKIHNLRMPTYYVIPSVETNDSLSEKQQLKLIWDKILLYSPEKFRQFITSPDQLKSAIHEFSDYAEQIREKFSESFFSNDDFLNSIINTSEDLISFKELLPKKSEILLKKFLSMSPEKFCKIVTSISALYNIINCFSKTAIEINNAVSIKNKFSNLFFDDNNEKYFFHIINKVEDIIEIKKLFPENKKLLLKKFLSPQKIFLSADLPQEQEKFFNVITSLSELQNLMNNFDDSYSDIEIKFCDKFYLIMMINIFVK